MIPASSDRRLLVFDCHEAWVYQLGALNRPLDIVIGLPGRAVSGWDAAMRPLPSNARCVRLEDVFAARETYDCIIAHNLTDLLDVKTLDGPRLLVLHATLGGLALDQRSATAPDDMRRALSQYARIVGAHVVAVSRLKGRSWGFDEEVVPLSVDPGAYLPYNGDLARGLRIANEIRRKTRVLKWEFHEKVFNGLPVTLVGRNEEIRGVQPARDWNDLKRTLQRHRFFIHTAEPGLEDGYNMAMLEAMAAGLPVLGNSHPTSPIRNGVNGFLSDDPAELRAHACRLLNNRDLAAELGRQARNTVAEFFTIENFTKGISRSIETARSKWLAFATAQPRKSVKV